MAPAAWTESVCVMHTEIYLQHVFRVMMAGTKGGAQFHPLATCSVMRTPRATVWVSAQSMARAAVLHNGRAPPLAMCARTGGIPAPAAAHTVTPCQPATGTVCATLTAHARVTPLTTREFRVRPVNRGGMVTAALSNAIPVRVTDAECAYRTAAVIVTKEMGLLVQDARRVSMKDSVSLPNVHPVYLGGTIQEQGVAPSVIPATHVTVTACVQITGHACVRRGGPDLHAVVVLPRTMVQHVKITVMRQPVVVMEHAILIMGHARVMVTLMEIYVPPVHQAGLVQGAVRNATPPKHATVMGFAHRRAGVVAQRYLMDRLVRSASAKH
jgi:hypothetical protein